MLEKKFKLKIFRVMKLTFKIIFSELLLRITLLVGFEYLILVFSFKVPNLTIEVIMKYNQSQTTFCYYLEAFDHENHNFCIP